MPVRKSSKRNLVQYRDLSDEEFYALFPNENGGVDTSPIHSFEERIQEKMESFEDDYDISDLKFNDMQTLRALCQALISLEDYENSMYRLKAEGVNESNLSLHDKLHKAITDTRADIAKLQDALRITRRIRKGDKQETVMSELQGLKDKANKFLEAKMFYVFCPECRMLLSTTWFLYPKADNKLVLHCGRILDDGSKCGTKVIVSSEKLLEDKGRNLKDIPEF